MFSVELGLSPPPPAPSNTSSHFSRGLHSTCNLYAEVPGEVGMHQTGSRALVLCTFIPAASSLDLLSSQKPCQQACASLRTRTGRAKQTEKYEAKRFFNLQPSHLGSVNVYLCITPNKQADPLEIWLPIFSKTSNHSGLSFPLTALVWVGGEFGGFVNRGRGNESQLYKKYRRKQTVLQD